MKRSQSLIAATAALGLAAFVCAQAAQPADPSGQATPSQQPMPSEEPTPAPATPGTPSAEQSAEHSVQAAQQEPAASGPTASGEPSTRLAAIVPSGMSAQEACTGFKSVSECVTALHASQNLNISFPDLKSKVTGGQKLGAAIHELKPNADVKAEMRKAEAQTREDLRPSQG